MKLVIIATPKSITISDDLQNRLSVIKTTSGIEFHSTVNDMKNNKRMLELQTKIKRVILNPTDNRDNYRIRFDRLAKQLTQVRTHSFVTLCNVLEK